VAALVCSLGLAAAPAGAQTIPFRRLPETDLAQPRRAPLTLTPSVTIAEEYNDNIFLNNANRQSDFITTISPGITVDAAGPTYHLLASYFFTAEVFAKETQLSHAFDRHNFSLDALYRVDPRTTLTLADTFTLDTNTNVVGTSDVATGRDRAWSNALALGASWAADPRTTLRGGLTWTVQRYDSAALIDSDVYRLTVGADRVLTPRLTGAVSYELAFFNIDRQEDVVAHTPRVGATYRFTPTLTGSLSAGPIVEVPEDSDLRVSPAVTAFLRQRMPWGSMGVFYDRALGTAGGLGGTTINQSVGGIVEVRTLLRGLTVDFGPRYSKVDSSRGSEIDVDSFTLPLSATYQFTPWAALVATYQFFRQRSDSVVTTSTGAAIAADADQNRIWVGMQFGYPFRVD
jgi:predicted porin